MNKQNNNNVLRQQKCRDRLKALGGRTLDITLDANNQTFLKKVALFYQLNQSELIRKMIKEAAEQIKYPIDQWLAHINSPYTHQELLALPQFKILVIADFELKKKCDVHFKENNIGNLSIYIYKDNQNDQDDWCLDVRWFYEDIGLENRFTHHLGYQRTLCNFLFEEGNVVFKPEDLKTLRKVESFCRYAKWITQQIEEKTVFRNQFWCVPEPRMTFVLT